MSTAAWHTSRSTANKWVLRVFSQPGCRIIDDADGGIRIPALHLAGGGDGGGGSSSGGRERLTFELLGMLKCESSKVRTARTLARSRPCMHACTLAHARARFAQTSTRHFAPFQHTLPAVRLWANTAGKKRGGYTKRTSSAGLNSRLVLILAEIK